MTQSPARRHGSSPLPGRPALAGALAALFLLQSTSPAWADAKQACAAAADAGQIARDQGRDRAAREDFVACARETCPKIVAQACGTWLRDLDAAMPTIVLGAKDETGADLTDVRVTLDGAPFATRLDGKPLAVDPGAHVVHFERDGAVPMDERVVARTGERNRLVVVVLRWLRTPEPAAASPSTASARQAPAASGGRIALGASLLALAAGAAATGGYFFALSLRASNDAAGLRAGLAGNASNDACAASSSATCGALGSDVDTQHRDAALGWVFAGTAGALVVAGATTLLLRPRAVEKAARLVPLLVPRLVPGGGGVTLGGTF